MKSSPVNLAILSAFVAAEVLLPANQATAAEPSTVCARGYISNVRTPAHDSNNALSIQFSVDGSGFLPLYTADYDYNIVSGQRFNRITYNANTAVFLELREAIWHAVTYRLPVRFLSSKISGNRCQTWETEVTIEVCTSESFCNR